MALVGFVGPVWSSVSVQRKCLTNGGRCSVRKGGWRMAANGDVLWSKVEGSDVYIPGWGGEGRKAHEVKGLVHFVPGALVSSLPSVFYGNFLRKVSELGYVVIATPYETSFDHAQIAVNVADKYVNVLREIQPRLPSDWLPTFGVGHSLGAKVQFLLNTDSQIRSSIPPRAGNVLISYNNITATESIPAYENWATALKGLDKLTPFISEMAVGLNQTGFSSESIDTIMRNLKGLQGEMKPSPAEMDRLIRTLYSCPDNMVVKFENDTIDQSTILVDSLSARFDRRPTFRLLKGTHLTPMTPEFGEATFDRSKIPFDLGETVGSIIETQVRNVRDRTEKELHDLVIVVGAFLSMRTEDIQMRLLKPSKGN